jgi:NAD binding domain of 6-phosphogluconate dehydrogenase
MGTAKPVIGFIGLGLMETRMAARLLEAGYPLTVYNRTRERTASLAERGAAVARTPQELAGSVDVVMLSVTDDAALDDAALDDVMRGPQGVLAGLRPGATVLDLSTVSPRISRELAAEVKSRGCAMLDTRDSGSTLQAEEGTLIILVGGDEDTYRRSEPILAVLGKQRFYRVLPDDAPHVPAIRQRGKVEIPRRALAFSEMPREADEVHGAVRRGVGGGLLGMHKPRMPLTGSNGIVLVGPDTRPRVRYYVAA